MKENLCWLLKLPVKQKQLLSLYLVSINRTKPKSIVTDLVNPMGCPLVGYCQMPSGEVCKLYASM